MNNTGTPIPDQPEDRTAVGHRAEDRTVEDATNSDTSKTVNDQNLSHFILSSSPGSRERVIAACRSLGDIGYADTPLGQINRVQHSAQRWIRSVQLVAESSTCQIMFPTGTPTLQQMHRLAVLHDKPVRPPKRFVWGLHAAHAKRRTPHALKQALSVRDELTEEMARHAHWLKTPLPETEESIAQLKLLLDQRVSKRWSFSRYRAARQFKKHLHSDQSLSRTIVSGNLAKLHTTLEKVFRFSQHAHFEYLLGPSFCGIHTPWRELAVQIGFSQSLLDIVQQPAVAADLVTNWPECASEVYALSRIASSASRRGRKLSRLANRLYKVGPTTEHLLLCGRKSAERLGLWVKLIESAEPEFAAYEHLTPRQLLRRLMPTPVIIEDLEEFDKTLAEIRDNVELA